MLFVLELELLTMIDSLESWCALDEEQRIVCPIVYR